MSSADSLDKQSIHEKQDHSETIGKDGNLKEVKKVVDVRNAALAAATATSSLNPWSKNSLILYCACFISFLCSCANGYDGSLMTAINIMIPYQNRFNAGETGSTTGIIFSMYNIGSLVGPWFAGPLTDRFGRRGGMFIGAIIICMGSAIIASAGAKPQFIAGRFILGFGVSVLTCAAPSYIVEVSPPQWRGRMTAFYNCGWFGGSIPAAAICLGTANIPNDLAWRLPLIFQCVPSAVVILTVWFLPESPRWLIANGRDAEAHAFLVKYHGNEDPSSPLVALEWEEFKEGIQTDGADKRWYDYSELYRNSNARWRSLMVVLMGVFGQFSGNGLGYFNTEIYKNVGYGKTMQFVLNLVSSIVSCFGALIGVSLSDRMPRRGVLVIGTFLCAILLAINGGLSTVWANAPLDAKNLSVGKGAVASYMFFQIIYSFSYTPLQALYPVECLQTTARAKGMSMYGVVVSLFGFINTFAGPIALQNMTYKYVFIFVGWDIIESVIWYFLAVETVGRSLEELDEIFSARNPVAASKSVQRIAVKEDGHIIVVQHS